MVKHKFGGIWTFIKLDVLASYLRFFNTALEKQPSETSPFKRIYIDAFAGTGQCEIKVGANGRRQIDGSATIAINSRPAFDEIHLIELKESHVGSLAELARAYPQRNVQIHDGDCNVELLKLLTSTNWRETRGVVFLDPYGMAVEWKTVEHIAQTEALDVWYWFPISAVYRQAANDMDDVDASKSAALDKMLGTPEWREAFYTTVHSTDFFSTEQVEKRIRHSDPNGIATWVHGRLASVFKGHVSQPVMLPEVGPPQFILFFAVSNPSEKAVKLSRKGSGYLFSKLISGELGRKAANRGAVVGNGDLFG